QRLSDSPRWRRTRSAPRRHSRQKLPIERLEARYSYLKRVDASFSQHGCTHPACQPEIEWSSELHELKGRRGVGPAPLESGSRRGRPMRALANDETYQDQSGDSESPRVVVAVKANR